MKTSLMPKETYYFSHDFDPTGDPKMSAMVGEYGAIGYGIFWRIVEMLHADKDHKLPLKKYLYQAISKQLLNTCKQNLNIDDFTLFIETFIKDCIEVFELFVEANEAPLQANEANSGASFFASNRVLKNIITKQEKKLEKSEAGRIGGIKSGESRRKKKANEANEAVLEANEPNEANKRKLNENINNNINKENTDTVCYNAEKFILENQQIFENICMATSKSADEVKKELHNYHLWMAKKENYPIGNRAVTAGIESWILNGNKFKNKYYNNGDQRSITAGGNKLGVEQLLHKTKTEHKATP